MQVTGNAFSDMPEGVRVGGADPDFGTILGMAVNVQVRDNRFCYVTTPVTVHPRATAMEQGLPRRYFRDAP